MYLYVRNYAQKKSMRIKSIKLKNIGVFSDFNLKFSRTTKSKNKAEIHIFTGLNGSGKSTLLYSLASAFDYFETGHENHVSNFYYKRFRYFEEKNKNDYRSEATMSLNGGEVKIYGCPNCKNIHSITRNKQVKHYRDQLEYGSEYGSGLDFIAFGYSGYRYIRSEQISSVKDFEGNPLGQSLEFVKNRAEDEEYDFSINQWIMNNLFKEAMAIKYKDEDTAQQLNNSIESFKKLINDITDFNIDFRIDLNPTKLNVVINNVIVDFDVLPDGLKSLISWVGDLMMVMDNTKWKNNNISIFERNIILFLDEIEVHLHPFWQRKVLPIIQDLFPNAQIFVSTHSPFVVNSIDGAWVHELSLNADNDSILSETYQSNTSESILYVLKKAFDINEEYGPFTQELIDEFYTLRDEVLSGDLKNKLELVDISKQLLNREETEITDIVGFEFRQLYKITNDKTFKP